MKLKDLALPMDYKMRTGPGGTQLAYITARQAQDRLDEVCGIHGWKVEYKELRGELFAGVSIKIGEEWVTKWDGGSESNIEKEKGAISDSFKRACVVWGLGRFLYTLGTKPQTPVYVMTTKDVDNWNGKIYGSSVYIDGDKKTISQEQITKLKAHEKFVELPPKK